MIDLSDRRVVAAIEALVRKQISADRRANQAVTRIGVVFGPPDTNGHKVAVKLLGQSEPSPGFSYGRTEPATGALVRVVIDPTGDRYVAEVLTDGTSGGLAALGAFFDIAADGSVALRVLDETGADEEGRLYLGRLRRSFIQAESSLPGVWLDPNVYTPGGFFGNTVLSFGDTLVGARAYIGTAIASDTYLRRAAPGVVGLAGLQADGGVFDLSTASILAVPPAAKRLRFVVVPRIVVFNAATTTSDIGLTATADITGLPTNAYAAYGEMMIMTSDTSAADMTVAHYPTGDTANNAWSPGVASHIGSGAFIAVLGGAFNRQLKYAVNWVSGTVTYWIWLHGYLTKED